MNATILALDTATEACSVALLHQGEITYLEEVAQRTHTRRILPMVDQILAQSGIRLGQVDALAFGRGPGSFTGVRVSAGIAQGLAFGADLAVIPISNLMTMAQAAYEKLGTTLVQTAIDARMNEVYFAQYQLVKNEVETLWQATIEEQVIAPANLLSLLSNNDATMAYKVGTGWAAYPELQIECLGQDSDIQLPSARYMLPIALNLWQQQSGIISPAEIEPVYLRNEVTWKKLEGR